MTCGDVVIENDCPPAVAVAVAASAQLGAGAADGVGVAAGADLAASAGVGERILTVNTVAEAANAQSSERILEYLKCRGIGVLPAVAADECC